MIKFEKRRRPQWGAVRRRATMLFETPPEPDPMPEPVVARPEPVSLPPKTGREELRALRARVVGRAEELFPGQDRLRFALSMPEEGTLHFFVADLPKEGKWRGAIFLKEQASDDLYRVRGLERETSILEEMMSGLTEAVFRYGQEIGVCGVCGRTLTDEESRARGIGPICLRSTNR